MTGRGDNSGGRASGQSGSPWRRVGAIASVLVFGGLVYLIVSIVLSGDKGPARKPPEIKIVTVLPPPPPPPPPPPEQPKMVEQTPAPEEKPKEMLKDEPKKDEPPPGPLSLDAKGEGPGDLFNLGGKPGGRGLFGAGGSRWGYYASMVQSQIEAALRAHPKARDAEYRIPIVRVWSDPTGRISRVQLASSTGSSDLDAVVREVLGSLVLREPPPKDMPMPINIRITKRQAG